MGSSACPSFQLLNTGFVNICIHNSLFGSWLSLQMKSLKPFVASPIILTGFLGYVWTNDGFLEHNAWNSFGLARLPHHPQYDDYRGKL